MSSHLQRGTIYLYGPDDDTGADATLCAVRDSLHGGYPRRPRPVQIAWTDLAGQTQHAQCGPMN